MVRDIHQHTILESQKTHRRSQYPGEHRKQRALAAARRAQNARDALRQLGLRVERELAAGKF
jgi:hypothetical protein